MSKTMDDVAFIQLLRALSIKVFNDNADKGFWDKAELARDNDLEVDYKISKMGLMTSEIGEAVEAVRKDLESDHLPGVDGEAEELADVVIRILDYCGAYDIPLGDVILRKLEYNRSRPKLHGKKA